MFKKIVLPLAIVGAVSLSIWQAEENNQANLNSSESSLFEPLIEKRTLINPSADEIYNQMRRPNAEREALKNTLPTTEGESGQAEQSSTLATSSQSPLLDGEPTQIVVDITDKQREAFFIIQDKLIDPDYVSMMSLSELTSSEEMKSLPEALQIAVLSNAIKQLNLGNVSREVFLGNASSHK